MGVIYILTRPDFPNFIRIGYTENLEKCVAGLNAGCAKDFPFSVYATYETHQSFKDNDELRDTVWPLFRVERDVDIPGLYTMTAEEAYKVLESVAKLSGTSDRLKRW